MTLLEGGNGNDILHGDVGTDSMDGGADADNLYADSDDDAALIFTGGTGMDNLRAALDTIAVDWVLVNGSSFENVFGSNMADTIDASAINDAPILISARGGNDFIWGTQLNDTINGGNDNDTLHGMGGAETPSAAMQGLTNSLATTQRMPMTMLATASSVELAHQIPRRDVTCRN